MKKSRPTNAEVQEMIQDGSLVEQYQDMVYKIAHSMKNTHPIEDFDELVSIGWYWVIHRLRDYDPEKSALSTEVYNRAWRGMKSHCMSPKTHREIPTDLSDPVFHHPAEESWLSSFMRDLGEDARVLVNACIEAPAELVDILRPQAPKTSRRALRSYMKKQGWDTDRLNLAWEEVSASL